MSKTALKALVLSEQPDNTQQLIKPVNVRTVENAIIDESLNIKDGGLDVEQLAGYKTLINISDDKAFTHKKYVDDALFLKQDRINGVVSGCVITVETFFGVGTNKRIRVTDGTWYITPSEYTKATDTVSSEITLCVTGGDFKYYDIVADDTGAITIYEGTPSTAPAHYVIDPLTEVLLGFITVGDAVIEEPAVIATSLTKKFEDLDTVTGSFTLDCESKDFPIFFIRLDGTASALAFNNYWNVVEGTIYVDVNSTTVLTLPTGSKTGGSPIASKTISEGNYKISFGYLYGEYYFDFDTVGGTGQVIQKPFELDFDGTEDTFEKTHNYYNDYITYSIRKADGTYFKETEYDVSSTTTTFTVVFVSAPASGTGKLTLQSVQNEAPSGGSGIGTGIIGSTFIVG